MAEEKETPHLKEIKDLIQQTVGNRVMLLKMEVADDLSRLIKGLILGSIAALLLFMCLLFVSLLLVNWIAEELGSILAGYGIVAGGYLLLIIIIVFVFGNAIGKKIDGMVLNALFKRHTDDDNATISAVTEVVPISNGQ